MSGQLKKIIGAQAYWVINKDLANDIGLDATLVLQHFIDLQTTFFKDGGFYQQQSRILEDLPISLDYLRKAVKVLQKKGFLSVVKRGVPAKNHYTVHEGNVMVYLSSISSGAPETRLEVSDKHDKHQELNNTKNKDTNIDVPSDDDIKGKIFFKIVEFYPKNRVGNRQHGLRKFKQLDIDQAKLAARNLNRYLKIAGQYVKSLQNYIQEECYSEAWLTAEEKTKQKQTSITDNKTKIFSGNYDDLD